MTNSKGNKSIRLADCRPILSAMVPKDITAGTVSGQVFESKIDIKPEESKLWWLVPLISLLCLLALIAGFCGFGYFPAGCR